MISNLSKAKLLLGLFFLSLSACLLEPQRAEDIFNNLKSLPEPLNSMANPTITTESMLKTLANKSEQGRIKVAVIDEGVDYMHPLLYKQIAFDWQGGKIVGAGYDVLGKDGFAHPNLIDPTIFAFTAESVVGGKINNVQGDPISLLMQMQKDAHARVRAGIEKDPALKASLFAKKMNEKSFIVTGLFELIEDSESIQKDYEKMKKEGKLLNYENYQDENLVKEYSKKVIDKMFNEPWKVEQFDSGVPIVVHNSLSYVENGDKMLNIFIQVANEISETYNYKNRLTNLFIYKKSMNKDLQDVGEVSSYLEDTLRTLVLNYSEFSPIVKLTSSVCKNLPDSLKEKLKAETNRSKKIQLVLQEYSRQTQVAKKLFTQLLKDDPNHQQEIESALEILENKDAVVKETFSEKRFVDFFSCDKNSLSDTGMIQFEVKRKHPYLLSSSASATHGSHVAGIVARQNKKIDIFPIRVITATPPVVPARATVVRDNFEKGFDAWLAKNEVQDAIRLESPSVFGKKLEHPLPVIRQEMSAYLAKSFRDNYLDYIFFGEILEAIKVVGEQKIKIANMSLGTKFEKAVVSSSDKSLNNRIKNFMKFLTYEYFKYSIAQQVQTHAKNTLFVIAAGNEGNWLDGHSRSGLPCDLSSPFLAKAQIGKPKEQWVANNNLSNILCVGSMDAYDQLSSFTNLPLTGIPFVISYGESILSPIKLTDCEGASQTVSEDYPNQDLISSRSLFSTDSDKYDWVFAELGIEPEASLVSKEDKGKPITSFQRKLMMMKLDDQLDTFSMTLMAALVQKRCMSKSKLPMAKLSGTSMATPAVAGFISAKLVAEINKKGLSNDAIYNHADYAPEKLIKLIQSKSPTFGGDSILKDVAKVNGIKNWKAPKASKNPVVGVVNMDVLLKGEAQ